MNNSRTVLFFWRSIFHELKWALQNYRHLVRSFFVNFSTVEWSWTYRSGDSDGITLSASRSHDLPFSRGAFTPTRSREKLMLLSHGKSPASLVLFPSLGRSAGLRHVHSQARKISSLPGTACLLFLHVVEIDLLQDRWRGRPAVRRRRAPRSSCLRASAYVKANLHALPLMIVNRMYRPRGWMSKFLLLILHNKHKQIWDFRIFLAKYYQFQILSDIILVYFFMC